MGLKVINNGGKHYLIVDAFKFRENRTLVNGVISWRCCVKDCNSWVKTDSGKTSILSAKQEHKHKAQCPSPSVCTSTPRVRSVNSPLVTSLAGCASSPHSASPLQEVDVPTTPLATALHTSTTDPSAENSTLREEISELRAQMKVLLDHSIESDQRLLQYTNEVFTAGPTMASDVPDPAQRHQATQTDIHDTVAVPNLLQEELQRKLQLALMKIKDLEQEVTLLNVPCDRCTILQEEAKNMITSIRLLEEENNSKKYYTNTTKPPMTEMPKPALTLHNRYEPLTINYQPENTEFKLVTYKKTPKAKSINMKQKPSHSFKNKPLPPQTNSKQNINFLNVTVVGDSHARHLAQTMRRSVSSNTTITGVCKPGAGLLGTAPTSTPPDDHCYVLLTGTNDVAAERQDIIYGHFEGILNNCRRFSKVLVCPLPPRHDLPLDSPVHETVARVNHYISELCIRYDGVEMIDISDIGRRHFTSHGLHLRSSGKRLLSIKIVESLSRLTPLRRRPGDMGPATARPATPELHFSGPFTLPHETYAQAVSQSPASTTSKTIHGQLRGSGAVVHYQQQFPPTDFNNLVFLGRPLIVTS